MSRYTPARAEVPLTLPEPVRRRRPLAAASTADLDQRATRQRRAAWGVKVQDARVVCERWIVRLGEAGLFRVGLQQNGMPSMAPDNSKRPPDDAVEAAIMRVLEAEASARDAVVRSRSEAAQIAELAREKARNLRLATDRRVRAVRAAFDARCAAEVAALEAEAAALRAAHDLTPAEISSIERAVTSLADAMTGDRS